MRPSVNLDTLDTYARLMLSEARLVAIFRLPYPAPGSASAPCSIVMAKCRTLEVDGREEWATWLLNEQTGGFTTGNYARNFEGAYLDFCERTRRALGIPE